MSEKKISFEVNRTSSAPRERLFALETDGANWARWAKPVITQSSWDRLGAPEPGGIGAIRKVRCGPMILREETVEYEQDRRHVYRFVGPFQPVANYVAEVNFHPIPSGGTELRWTASFTPTPGLGRIAVIINRGIIRAVSARLVRAAENTTSLPHPDKAAS